MIKTETEEADESRGKGEELRCGQMPRSSVNREAQRETKSTLANTNLDPRRMFLLCHENTGRDRSGKKGGVDSQTNHLTGPRGAGFVRSSSLRFFTSLLERS